jgi:hypothetical protein
VLAAVYARISDLGRRNLVVTRRTIRLCGQDIDKPGHICAFFSSRNQEYETLLPYFKEGFDANEQIVSVLDASRIDDHKSRLSDSGIDADSSLIATASSEDTYLDRGRFDIERMAGFVEKALRTAAAEGRRVRTAGWMDWLHHDIPGSDRVMEYEARMNLLFPNFDCTFMCVYDLTKLTGEMVVDIMATHPYVILNGSVRQNPFYVPPDVYLTHLIAPKSEPESNSTTLH